MCDSQVPVPEGQDFHITRSGREFTEFSGPSSSIFEGVAKNFENSGAGAGAIQAVESASSATTEKRGAEGHWADSEASEASSFPVGPNFSGGMGSGVGLEPGNRAAPSLEFSQFLKFFSQIELRREEREREEKEREREEKKREREEKLSRSAEKAREKEDWRMEREEFLREQKKREERDSKREERDSKLFELLAKMAPRSPSGSPVGSVTSLHSFDNSPAQPLHVLVPEPFCLSPPRVLPHSFSHAHPSVIFISSHSNFLF